MNKKTNKIMSSAGIVILLLASIAFVSGSGTTNQIIEVSPTTIATHSVQPGSTTGVGTVTTTHRGCIDKCGDGTCQEVVCEATTCPCAETVRSCPQDCGDAVCGNGICEPGEATLCALIHCVSEPCPPAPPCKVGTCPEDCEGGTSGCDTACQNKGYKSGTCRMGPVYVDYADTTGTDDAVVKPGYVGFCYDGEVDIGASGCPEIAMIGTGGTTRAYHCCCKREEEERCAKEGQYTTGALAPEYYVDCCEGLEGFDTHGGRPIAGAGLLCYNPRKGKPVCKNDGSEREGWYYSQTGELLRLEDCYQEEPEPTCTPICKAMSSRSEGWYDSCTGELIKYASCACYAVCRGGVGVGEGTERGEGYYSSCTGELILKANCATKEPIRVTVREREVRITQVPIQGVVKIGSVEDAVTREKLTVTDEGLGISTDVGVVRVVYRPEEAKEKAIQVGGMKEVTGIELVEEKGVAVYHVDGKVPGKVLWIFPVTRDGTVKVDAGTNEVIQ